MIVIVLTDQENRVREGCGKDGFSWMHRKNKFPIKEMIRDANVSLEDEVPLIGNLFIVLERMIFAFGLVEAFITVEVSLRERFLFDFFFDELFFFTECFNLKDLPHMKVKENLILFNTHR